MERKTQNSDSVKKGIQLFENLMHIKDIKNPHDLHFIHLMQYFNCPDITWRLIEIGYTIDEYENMSSEMLLTYWLWGPIKGSMEKQLIPEKTDKSDHSLEYKYLPPLTEMEYINKTEIYEENAIYYRDLEFETTIPQISYLYEIFNESKFGGYKQYLEDLYKTWTIYRDLDKINLIDPSPSDFDKLEIIKRKINSFDNQAIKVLSSYLNTYLGYREILKDLLDEYNRYNSPKYLLPALYEYSIIKQKGLKDINYGSFKLLKCIQLVKGHFPSYIPWAQYAVSKLKLVKNSALILPEEFKRTSKKIIKEIPNESIKGAIIIEKANNSRYLTRPEVLNVADLYPNEKLSVEEIRNLECIKLKMINGEIKEETIHKLNRKEKILARYIQYYNLLKNFLSKVDPKYQLLEETNNYDLYLPSKFLSFKETIFQYFFKPIFSRSSSQVVWRVIKFYLMLKPNRYDEMEVATQGPSRIPITFRQAKIQLTQVYKNNPSLLFGKLNKLYKTAKEGNIGNRERVKMILDENKYYIPHKGFTITNLPNEFHTNNIKKLWQIYIKSMSLQKKYNKVEPSILKGLAMTILQPRAYKWLQFKIYIELYAKKPDPYKFKGFIENLVYYHKRI